MQRVYEYQSDHRCNHIRPLSQTIQALHTQCKRRKFSVNDIPNVTISKENAEY